MKRREWLIAAAALPMVSTALAQASGFRPSKPVTLIIPHGAGGGTDAVGRLFAARLGEMWRQTVIVENMPGADGTIGSARVAKADPDGTTLLLTVASLAINPALYPKLPYDTLTAFTPITDLALPVVVMVGSPKLEASNIKELVAAARRQPGKFTFASSETSTRMYGERLKEYQNIDLVFVPYKSSPQFMTDIIAGVVDTGFSSVTSAMPFVKSGRIKVLGVLSQNRSNLVPEVQTSGEQGVPGLESRSWYGLFGPGHMPAEVTESIHADVLRVLAMPDVKAKLAFLGAEPGGETPAQFSTRFERDVKDYAALIPKLNIHE